MAEKDLKTKDLSHVDVARLKKYPAAFKNTDDDALADKAVGEFLSNYAEWKDVVGYMIDGEDGEQLYGEALTTFSGNLYLSNTITPEMVDLLRGEITEYEGKVVYVYGYKEALYSNLVLCLHRLVMCTDKELIDLMKKAIYYSQARANHTSYQIECYAYRSTADYMLDAFRNEKVSMSPPTTFNDPFDCPILELLNQYGDKMSKLMREAYQDCIKVTCFVSNKKLEPEQDAEGNFVRVVKHEGEADEYLNELMWAHYASNHKGICIKYHFRNDFTSFADQEQGQIAYFRDVEYTSDMDMYRKNGAINLKDAFFAKSKAWEYENELRLLTYDPKGVRNYASTDAKNSVAAVYFGLKCPDDKQKEIMDILKGRKWVNVKSTLDMNTNEVVEIKEEHEVEFFKMVVDENHFGKLKAVKIV